MLESLWFYQWAISTLSHILHWAIFCTEPYPALSHILLWATSCTEPYLTLSHTVPHPALNHSCTEPYPVLSHILCWAILTLNNIYWATSTLNHILYWVISCMEPYSTLSYIPHRATSCTEPHPALSHISHWTISYTGPHPALNHIPQWATPHTDTGTLLNCQLASSPSPCLHTHKDQFMLEEDQKKKRRSCMNWEARDQWHPNLHVASGIHNQNLNSKRPSKHISLPCNTEHENKLSPLPHMIMQPEWSMLFFFFLNSFPPISDSIIVHCYYLLYCSWVPSCPS